MMDEIKFLRTKLSEKDREIDFLKQDLNRTMNVSFMLIVYVYRASEKMKQKYPFLLYLKGYFSLHSNKN